MYRLLSMRLEAIANNKSIYCRLPYLHCSVRLEQGLQGLLWAWGFKKKTRGEVDSTQSALNGTLARERAGADEGENICWFRSAPRQRVEILTRYHSKKTGSVLISSYSKWISLSKRLKKSAQNSFSNILHQYYCGQTA